MSLRLYPFFQTIPLWRLLFEILHYQSMKINRQEIIEKFDRTPKGKFQSLHYLTFSLSSDQLVNFIQNDLFTRGYTYEHFLSLDNQMLKGSRQLLICLGWLIYHVKLIDHCLEQCLNKDSIFDYDDTSALHLIDKQNNDHRIQPMLQEKDLINQVKQAMRINAKLRFTLRKLHGLVIENANLQHQVNPFSLSSSH